MPSQPKLGPELNRGRRSASFSGLTPATSDKMKQINRLGSHPELPRGRSTVNRNSTSPDNGNKKLTKLLLNVTIQRSLGPVQVVMPPESTVAELIKAAVEAYVKEGRRPLLIDADPQSFELHYSQFSLESLNPKEKLINLGSRNFFLCPKQSTTNSCSNEANKVTKTPSPWLRFMDFLL